MLPFVILENTFIICSALFLVGEVDSQTAYEDSQVPNRFRSCDASSYCIPIRRCSSFRDGWNRRGVGITCGYGIGPYRRVCCPRVHEEEVPVRQTRRTTTTTPVPTASTGNSEDCGLSQGIDWFQEHALNDTDALEATWPWMVAIRGPRRRNGPLEPLCSGFLINKTHVLSAAQCFETRWTNSTDVDSFTARIGSDDQDLAEEYPISEIKVHEGFKKGSFYHDIALLKLAREVNVPNFVPICLPDDEVASMDLAGWGATVVGWGTTSLDDRRIVNIVKQLNNVPILNNEECEQIFKSSITGFTEDFPRGITKDMLCAGMTEGAREACVGMAGGPLMVLYKKRWYAVGLSSFGPESCGIPGIPSGNTRVSSYVDWIRPVDDDDYIDFFEFPDLELFLSS